MFYGCFITSRTILLPSSSFANVSNSKLYYFFYGWLCCRPTVGIIIRNDMERHRENRFATACISDVCSPIKWNLKFQREKKREINKNDACAFDLHQCGHQPSKHSWNCNRFYVQQWCITQIFVQITNWKRDSLMIVVDAFQHIIWKFCNKYLKLWENQHEQ